MVGEHRLACFLIVNDDMKVEEQPDQVGENETSGQLLATHLS